MLRAFRPIAVLGLLLAGAAVWLASPAAAGERGPAAQQTPAAIYHNYCSVCHGDNGDGQSRARGSLKPPPRDFTTPQALQELNRERMITVVTGGVPGTAMMPWKTQLSDKQIAAVVDYVRDTFMRASLNADASPGRRIYAQSCAVCHGDRGAGSMWASANLRPAPRDFSSPQARSELTRERMLASVAAGRPGTAMAGFARQLSADEMGNVVDYIRSSFMRVDAIAGTSGAYTRGVPPATPAAKPAVAPVADMKQPLPFRLRGNADAGRRFYDANCATCHGVRGDGQGPRAYFINPKPQVFISAQSRAFLNRPVIYAAVSAGKRGTEMPAWDKVLSKQELADVSEYVFRAFIAAGGSNVAKRP